VSKAQPASQATTKPVSAGIHQFKRPLSAPSMHRTRKRPIRKREMRMPEKARFNEPAG
jgi:hypothetical protein